MSDTQNTGAKTRRLVRIPGIARRLFLAQLALLWEALWPNLWPILGVVGVFAALVLFDILPLLPGWLHVLVLALLALALLRSIWISIRQIRLPGAGAAQRRLERDSGVQHRPLSTLADIPSSDLDNPDVVALWQIHLTRAFESVKKLRVRLPQPGLAARDPKAIRFAVLLAVIVGVVFAGGDAQQRLARAVTPELQGLTATQAATLELWVTPPDYTDLPPRLLASADQSAIELSNQQAAVEVPVGSRLLALVNLGTGTPQLVIGERSSDLDVAGEKAWRVEAPLDNAGLQSVSVMQSGEVLGSWIFYIAEDAKPEITFAEPPTESRRQALQISYRARDDFGVISARADIFGPSGDGSIGKDPLKVELPPPLGDPRNGAASSFHDLTAHPWAGLDVSIQLVAVDGPGQEGRSDRLSIKLPERVFHHPVAQQIIAQRRALALAENQRLRIARELHGIAARPDAYDNDTTVFLSLIAARSRLVHNNQEDAIDSVQTLLWETALRVEDGNLSLAERELRDIQRRLQEALSNEASDEEIAELIEELREALNRFLDAFSQNLREQLRDVDVTNLPQRDTNDRFVNRRDLNDILNQLEQLARTGDRDSAQQLLSQLQQMLENLQNRPLAGQQPQQSQAQQMMRQLQDIVRQQQELYDRTFRNGQQDTDNPQQSADDAEAQNALRRQLGEIMRQLGEMTGRIPQNLGNAERAMRDAEGALGQGDTDSALSAQAEALEELRQGARNMAAQLFRQPGQGPGDQPGPGFLPIPGEETHDPLGRAMRPPDGNNGFSDDGRRENIGSTFGAERVLQIQRELRNRLNEEGRSQEEIDYILRLLRRF